MSTSQENHQIPYYIGKTILNIEYISGHSYTNYYSRLHHHHTKIIIEFTDKHKISISSQLEINSLCSVFSWFHFIDNNKLNNLIGKTLLDIKIIKDVLTQEQINELGLPHINYVDPSCDYEVDDIYQKYIKYNLDKYGCEFPKESKHFGKDKFQIYLDYIKYRYNEFPDGITNRKIIISCQDQEPIEFYLRTISNGFYDGWIVIKDI